MLRVKALSYALHMVAESDERVALHFLHLQPLWVVTV